MRIKVYVSAMFKDCPREIEIDDGEYAIFRKIYPRQLPTIYLNWRAGPGSIPYARYAERMPGGRSARHTLARYLMIMSEYWVFRFEGGPRPPTRYPPIRLVNGNQFDLRPENRELVWTPVPGQSTRRRRVGDDAAISVRIRVDAVFEGRDPDLAWVRYLAKRNARFNRRGS